MLTALYDKLAIVPCMRLKDIVTCLAGTSHYFEGFKSSQGAEDVITDHKLAAIDQGRVTRRAITPAMRQRLAL